MRRILKSVSNCPDSLVLSETETERSRTANSARLRLFLDRAEIRTTSYLLDPPVLDEIGLYSALNWYVHGIRERSELDIRLEIPEDFGRLPRDMELVIFRLVG